MSELIKWEMQYMAVAITAGVLLAAWYDVIRIFRRIVKHGVLWISVEDILYWMLVGIICFGICFIEDAGNIRGFAIGGEILGASMYHFTISTFLVRNISRLLNFPILVIKKALKKLKESYTIKNTDKN